MTYELWFNYDGSLFVTHRTEPFTPAVGRKAIEALLDGPTAEERAAKVGTSINAGTRLLDLTIDDSVATVDLDSTFIAKETLASVVSSLGQVVYTLTQFDSVQGVVFEVEGDPFFESFGDPGWTSNGGRTSSISFPSSWSRARDRRARLESRDDRGHGGRVRGGGVDRDPRRERRHGGVHVHDGHCGTGCRGSYTTDVEYSVGTRQPGTIRVYEVSAMDGSSIHIVEIPVMLTP